MTPTRVTETDDATLVALTDLCLRSKAHWGYDVAFMAACRDVLQVTHDDLRHPLAVIHKDGGLAGMVQVVMDGDTAELGKLFVAPEHMGTGLGTALVQWAKGVARAAGHCTLRVESDPDAEGFYMAQGAVRVGQAPSEVIPGRMLPLLSLPCDA